MSLPSDTRAPLARLREVLDRRIGIYRELAGVSSYDAYLDAAKHGEDEEVLTEPVLADILESVLGFPADGYLAQLSRSGLKPDFTPRDLVAHRFVLDAKSSTIAGLDTHERQIRSYVDQRRLDFGVLFNLREVRVYRRSEAGHVPALSFALRPLWQVAREEALPGPEVERFERFLDQFRFRSLDSAQRLHAVRSARSWRVVEAGGERLSIDVEYLVDRLRELSRTLAGDAAAQQDALDRQLRMDPELSTRLVAELRMLALDLAPGTDVDALPDAVAGFRSGGELAERVWRQYLLRVSQLALTRILLYRSWEDAGFVEERLYDGGFGVTYERLGRKIGDVLDEAFAAGRDRYPWLYGGASTYDWYRPRDEVLVDVLYALMPVPLGKLDADVLGGLYESYVDEIDRDRLGQFYTPRGVVRFMLDRAGFTEAASMFRLDGDERRPRRVLDFATGSGGFLVEAARRIVEEVVDGGVRDVDDGLAAVTQGLHGAEISPFPYYLTEVNLLLQVSRLLGRLRQLDERPPRALALGVVHADTLSTRLGTDASLEGLRPEERADRAVLDPDRRFDITPLDPAKSAAFGRIAEPESFDLVVGNPPYVAEAGNRVLFDRLRRLPGWKATYRGKSDYLYYFLLYAAERLRPGGRLAVITPAGWMNAGDAEWLRKRLVELLTLDELFLFGSHRIFAPERTDARDRRRAQAPTVESLVLVATKGTAAPGHRVRVTVLEDERQAARALTADAAPHVLDRDALLTAVAERADHRGGRRDGILVHSVRQDRLRSAEPWPVKFSTHDLASRLVAHLDAALADDASAVEPLARRWRIFQGIQTGADAYSGRVQKRLSADDRAALEAAGRRSGEPILELPAGRELEAPWREHPDLLARSVEPRAILYGALDEGDYTHLVWIARSDDVPEPVIAVLEPWRRVLATRAEFARNARRRWYETAWPRDKAEMRAPKVIALYRTDRGRFALDESGAWQPSIKTTICTAREDGLSVAYLCGLLNSELLDLWYAVRGKAPRDIWRNYEPKPMARIPYRHVALPPEPTARLSRLSQSADAAALLAAVDDVLADPTGDGELALALEAVVRVVGANRRALLPHRSAAPALKAIVKDPWRIDPPVLEPAAVIAELRDEETVSVRIDPTLRVTISSDGPLGRPHAEGSLLRFRRARQLTAAVEGPEERLALLARVVDRRALPADLERTRLPKDLPRFAVVCERRLAEIDRLLMEGRDLVERAERLVCRLYGLPDELTEEVVASAVQRAQGRGPEPDDDPGSG